MSKRLMRVLSFLLSLVVFFMLPLNAYASVVSVASSSNVDIDDFGNFDDFFESDEILEEQFQRYDQSLIDYPETLIGKSPYSRIALADDAVIILTALLSLVGVYIANRIDLTAFITTFEIWLRQMYGNVPEIMQVWQAILNPVDTVKITGLKVFLPVLWKYMKDKVNGYGSGSTDLSVDDKILFSEPFYVFPDSSVTSSVNYGFSFKNDRKSSIDFYDFYFDSLIDLSKIVVVCEWDYISSYYRYTLYSHDSISDSLKKIYYKKSSLYYSVSDDVYSYPNTITESSSFTIYPRETDYTTINIQLPFLVFSGKNYALSYFKSGTMGGLISGQTTSITADKAWSQLQQDALDRFGDTLTIPSPEAWQDIQNRLSSSATADDVLSALGTIFEINPSGGGGTVSTRPFVDLSYLLDAVAVYAGATALTADQRTAFLKDYLKLTIEGGTVEQLNQWATTVLLSQVAITGSDVNNDNNSFVISSALATALLSYLVTIGLLDAVPSIAVGEQITANIRVGEKTVNPDTPSTDLTGILSVIKALLTAVGGLPVLIGVEVATAFASSTFASGITLGIDNIRSALGEIAQWNFADWATALGIALLLPLRTVADELGLDSITGGIDSLALALDGIAGWNFADWSNVFRTALEDSLSVLGLAGIAGLLDDVKGLLSGLNISVDFSDLLKLLESWADAILDIPGTLLALLDLLVSLPADIASALLELLQYLFVPTSNPFMGLQDKLDSKFPLFGQLKSLLDGFVFTSSDDIPEFNFTYMGVTVNIFNIAWFSDYLPFIHLLIVAFAYYYLIKRLYKRLPRLIGGLS